MVYAIGKKSEFEIEPDAGIHDAPECLNKIEYLNPDAIDYMANKNGAAVLGQGYPVAPETAPKIAYWWSTTILPPDYLMGNNEFMLVSGKFRDLVEQFEPGVHQFLPVDLYYSDQHSEPFDRFYWFVCCQLIDSLDPEHTTLTWRGGDYNEYFKGLRDGYWYFDSDVTPPQKAVFSLKAIGDRHLWRDPYYYRSMGVFCSSAFGNAMVEAGLTGFGTSLREQI
jgi:hypothetical protein